MSKISTIRLKNQNPFFDGMHSNHQVSIRFTSRNLDLINN